MDPETLSTIILLGSFFIMILLRFPIAYAVGISTALCLVSMGQSLVSLPQLMVKGVWSFSLMAVPFFITMGVLMGSGGISDKLIALANSLVGWMRGGLAQVNIVASYFFGGISGSAAADTASLGSILIPMMVDEGYDADFSTAVTITSSCEGLLVPPSHNMVLYATTAGGVSVGALFMAGYLPGALLAIALMVGSYILSVKRNYPKGERFSIKRFIQQLGKSIWALLAVLIVVVILLLNLILLILGMIMDMAPIILIATPILLPVATSVGLHPVQFGIMMVLNCGIGLLTPPVGSVLFIGSAVAKRPMEKVVKATLPFYLCMILALLLISFIPQISLWLPRITGAL